MSIKKYYIIIAVSFLALSAFMPQAKIKKVPKLKTLFACKQSGLIAMSAEQFLSLMNQPMCAKDSLDSLYTVTKFELVYAETGLYQDSAGLPIRHTDYTFAAFTGNTVSDTWKKLFKDHAYRGDTIRIQNVRAKGSANINFRSSNIEVVLR